MPELPEVTTIIRELNRTVRGKIIRRVETDSEKLIRPLTRAQFQRRVVGKCFLAFHRRAKFIIATLGEPPIPLLWHMGMTGHPLYRDPKREARQTRIRQAMRDPVNQHVRLTFFFTDGTRLEYADIRKFGKIELLAGGTLRTHPQLKKLGPEALELARSPRDLCTRLHARNLSLKVALMNQSVIAGMGNIYVDEALWTARLHPLLRARQLSPASCRVLARAIRTVLTTAIRTHGTSIDDFRRTSGEKGRYGDLLKAYQRAGLPCVRCGTLIQRLVVGGRGTHVCSRCQRRHSSDP